EEAVLLEFDRLNSRGGVLGAMERQYQRTKIQEESLYYERQKESGEYPIVGVNTFLSKEGSPFVIPTELIRSSDEAKKRQISNLRAVQDRNSEVSEQSLRDLQAAAVGGDNLFEQLMETSKTASLGEMSNALYAVGGQYRRNM
ncbi:MAG: methylmalonyl-CoA mutase family protein, partial [Acidimicrobiia bacterium]